MKKYIFFLISILLSLSIHSHAQTGRAARITWPVDGTIFQQGEDGTLDVQFAGQLGYGTESASIYQIYITTLESQNCPGTCQTYLISTLDYSANWNTSLTGFKSFKTIQNLPKGWYRASLVFRINLGPFGIIQVPFHTIKFGVGDVYFIAGQSNASGFNEAGDNVQNYAQTYPVSEQKESIRIIGSTTDSNFGTVNLQGLPFNTNFTNLKNGDGTANGTMRIYPNGRDSWYWALFAHRMSKDKKTPVLLFNLATPDKTMEQWSSTDPNLLKQLRRGLQTYGNILGAKAVLWHQGENDCRDLRTTSNQTNYLSQYTTRLNGLISTSRNSITINGTDKLSWYVSKVSHHYAADGWTVMNPINPLSPDPVISSLSCASLRPDITKKMISSNLKSAQTNSPSNHIFLGVDSDLINECSRAKTQIIHFTGNNNGLSTNSLTTMGDNWYNAVNNSYPTQSVKRQDLLPITVTKDNGTGNYTLTAPSGYTKYYWVQNGNSVYAGSYLNDGGNTSNPNCIITTGTQNAINYYICYVTNDTNIETARFQVCHPFVMKNTIDAQKGLKLKQNAVEISSLSFNPNPEQKGITVESTNVIWDTADQPSWITLSTPAGGYDETLLNISTNQSNTTGNIRIATLRIKENGTSNGYEKTLTITQAATTGCTTTNLSSITPTSVSQPDFGTLHYNQSVSGGALNVGTYSTNNGLGTHAYSNIVYTLGGQYNTFTFRVGRDNASDGCNCGTMKIQFKVYVDNVLKFTSPLMGTTDEPYPAMTSSPQAVSIAGANTLRLEVTDGGDNYYGDHADWLDAKLECSTPPSCTAPNPPTTITSTCNSPVPPNTSCTLQTTCASGSSPSWNNGQTGNSITVSPSSTTTYSVKCVSGNCESSPVTKTVSVTTSGCSSVVDGLVMGTWTVTGQQLKVRYFDSKYWLTQVVSTSPDAFVVRGSAMLQRSDVTLNNSSYSGLTNCFYYVDGGIQGLTTPTDFSTPSGYSLSYSGSTPVYTASGTPPSCTNTDLTNNWFYASSDVNPPPKINTNQNGTAININGTTYAKGIGTHAFSEIIYDLGTSHNFEYFKADVGRDLGSATCGCGGQTIIFKVLNANTNAVLAGPITKGNGQSATPISASISGVSKIKLVVEDGGDNNWGDWADWANARLTCPSGARIRSDLMEEIKPQNFTLSPNPADDLLNVKFSVEDYSKVTFEVIDINGRKLDNYSFMAEKGNHSFSIDVTGISPGMYFLRAFISSKTGDTSLDNLKTEVIRFMIER
jgi:hypothetical protein